MFSSLLREQELQTVLALLIQISDRFNHCLTCMQAPLFFHSTLRDADPLKRVYGRLYEKHGENPPSTLA